MSSAYASSVWDIKNVYDVTGSFTINNATVQAYNSTPIVVNYFGSSIDFTNGAIGYDSGYNETTVTFNNGFDTLSLAFLGNILDFGIGPISLNDAVISIGDNIASLLMYKKVDGRRVVTSNIIDPPGIVPEPTSIALLIAGLLGFGVSRRRTIHTYFLENPKASGSVSGTQNRFDSLSA